MLQFILKFLIAGMVAIAWHYLTGNMQIAIFFFLFVLAILWLKPITFQNPKQREEFIQKMKEARERQAFLESERLEEKKKLRSDGDREEKQRQDFKNLKKRMGEV
ncbi:hypothetical protein CCZ01_05475 [Helicobacter monodelphidis]|uniref:hypothetical protein n=1 Tax=Helicobacter sp. 15-1451 TaxID=2004995 RepID=UPI000DCC1C86|nr:hypothetical protein [Helicobacter sp. 15-1451]RAX57592.1 hypothetical protein CCZ01_05475 [Helicobacter sp. 15-1451]